MATSYTFVTYSAANTAPILSNRVRVVANNSCYYAINTIASPTANAGPMIAQLRPTDINMQGVGNFISIVPASNTLTAITVTQLGGTNVAPSKIDPTYGNVVMRTA